MIKVTGYAQTWFDKGYYFVGDSESLKEASDGKIYNVEFLDCKESFITLKGAVISKIKEIK